MKRTSLIVTILALMSLMFVGLRFLPEAWFCETPLLRNGNDT